MAKPTTKKAAATTRQNPNAAVEKALAAAEKKVQDTAARLTTAQEKHKAKPTKATASAVEKQSAMLKALKDEVKIQRAAMSSAKKTARIEGIKAEFVTKEAAIKDALQNAAQRIQDKAEKDLARAMAAYEKTWMANRKQLVADALKEVSAKADDLITSATKTLSTLLSKLERSDAAPVVKKATRGRPKTSPPAEKVTKPRTVAKAAKAEPVAGVVKPKKAATQKVSTKKAPAKKAATSVGETPRRRGRPPKSAAATPAPATDAVVVE